MNVSLFRRAIALIIIVLVVAAGVWVEFSILQPPPLPTTPRLQSIYDTLSEDYLALELVVFVLVLYAVGVGCSLLLRSEKPRPRTTEVAEA